MHSYKYILLSGKVKKIFWTKNTRITQIQYREVFRVVRLAYDNSMDVTGDKFGIYDSKNTPIMTFNRFDKQFQ